MTGTDTAPDTAPEMDRLFAGGGLLGSAMASTDWAQTPLGPPETWPPGLRSVVRVLLTSRFPMWMAWGDELTMFYNDAYYHDTLRAKHPWALGRPASQVWSEIWDDIGPRIFSVLETGVATWDEELLLFLERSGYPEETYHTFSYSPLDEQGRVAGMLCVVTENTDRVLSERRMATLHELATALAPARTEADVLTTVGARLAQNRRDLPYTAVYFFENDGAARLVATSGIEPGAPGAPARIAADGAAHRWPLERLRTGGTALVDDLAARFGPLPTGAWDRPPEQAAALPLPAAQAGEPPRGFLLVGLNPFRPFDDRYRGFVELLAGQVTASLAAVGAYEAERRRAEALAELDRAKTDFFANVSHEFRTPLALIMGPLDDLRTAPFDPVRIGDELAMVRRNALRLNKLVNTLLEFSRLQAGRTQATFAPVNLGELTAQLASTFRSAMDRAGLAYHVDCPPLDEPVWVDQESWEKIVLNLLSNALKFTFDGAVGIRLRRTGGSVVLTVDDTGVGIPDGELVRIFERFHRIEGVRARSAEGSGIGLAMVQELVSLHGGEITATSTLAVGTRFTVTLPLGCAHLPADQLVDDQRTALSGVAEAFVAEALRWLPSPDVAVERRAAEPDTARTAGRVLIADDNADMREYLTRLLSARWDVTAVEDGAQALASAAARPPDLVVSDVMMPGVDGMALLAGLRADPRTARVPVVLLSARAGQEAAVEGLAAGADDYLVKPFTAAELLARVGAHLRMGRVRREAEARFTATADLAPALIWVADRAGSRVFLNAGWRDFTGNDPTADLGIGWRACLHAHDRDRYDETTGAAMAQQRGWEIEYRLRHADGTYHWVLEQAVMLSPVDGADSRPLGWVGSCVDINVRYRETERQTLLAEVAALLAGDGELTTRMQALVDRLVASRTADQAAVLLTQPGGQRRRIVSAGAEPALRSTVDAVAEGHPDVPDRTLVVPLTSRGRSLGALALGRSSGVVPFDAHDRDLLVEVAERAALAVDNATLLADERAAAGRLALLQAATAELSAAAGPEQVATTVMNHLEVLLGRPRLGVYELDEARPVARALALRGVPDAEGWQTVPLDSPAPIAVCVREHQPLWMDAAGSWRGRHPETAAVVDALGVPSAVALPLIVAGRPIGAIGIGFADARRLSPSERTTLLALTEPAAQALDRARLYRAEHRIAQTLQRRLLPDRLPELDRLAHASVYLPGAEGMQAGGDWYDVIALGESRAAVVVGDVVGHGPEAAAVMGQLRIVLSGALRQGLGPSAALNQLSGFASWIPGARASTALCLLLDWERGELRWSRAGHLPPLLIRPERSQYLDDAAGHGPVLGLRDGPAYTEGVTDIAPGDTLLLYTDGLVERRDEDLDDGLERLTRTVAELGTASPRALVDRLPAALLTADDQADDVALVCVRLLPPPLRLVVPARPEQLPLLRRRVHDWAHRHGMGDVQLDDLQLALGEAAANCSEHAYPDSPGDMELDVQREPDGRVRAQVRDHGRWRPPPADPGYRGRGLTLIRALTTSADVHGDDEGTVVRFDVPAPETPDAEAPTRPRTMGPTTRGAELRTIGEDADGWRLDLQGDLDLAGAAAVRAPLLDRVLHHDVLLRIPADAHLGSNGAALLAEAAESAHATGHRLRLQVTPDSAPFRALEIIGLAHLIDPPG